MRVDLQSRSTGTISFLSTCRATVPMLLILMACLSCSTPPVEMSQPRYGVVGPLAFLFSDPLTKGDDRQSAHRRLNAQPTFDTMSPKSRRPPKSRRHTDRLRREHLLRAVLRKNQTRQPYLMRKKTNCSKNFWNGGSIRRKSHNELACTKILRTSGAIRRTTQATTVNEVGASANASREV
jgi:hypothetical protein